MCSVVGFPFSSTTVPESSVIQSAIVMVTPVIARFLTSSGVSSASSPSTVAASSTQPVPPAMPVIPMIPADTRYLPGNTSVIVNRPLASTTACELPVIIIPVGSGANGKTDTCARDRSAGGCKVVP